MSAGVATREAVESEVRSWIAANWDPDRSLREWRTLLADSGWGAPSWPIEWHGRGLPGWADEVTNHELGVAGAVGVPLGAGIGLAAPTILAHGGDAVKARFLLPVLTGEHTWCQLFSEPSNGSDLAGLTTRADLDGDEWVINGQKLWSTSAHHADYGLLLARSDFDVPKHKGISAFVLPMHQPGVEARPLKQMNYRSSFNEVFITDARIPLDHTIGEPGEGWRVALTTLAFERRFGSVRRQQRNRSAGRAVAEAEVEADEYFATYQWYPQRAGRVDIAVPRAQDNGTNTDPLVRDGLAGLLSLQRAHQLTSQRAAAALAKGVSPGATGSLGKLGLSDVARAAADVHSSIIGAHGMLNGSGEDEIVAEVLISVPAQSIAGGTDEIQHNIIGEQLLGLPREPAVDRDMPFRDIGRSGTAR
ncbi:MAG: acyl-CoA dehydrogenase family protein [Ilumatobacteraceae bacterium]